MLNLASNDKFDKILIAQSSQSSELYEFKCKDDLGNSITACLNALLKPSDNKPKDVVQFSLRLGVDNHQVDKYAEGHRMSAIYAKYLDRGYVLTLYLTSHADISPLAAGLDQFNPHCKDYYCRKLGVQNFMGKYKTASVTVSVGRIRLWKNTKPFSRVWSTTLTHCQANTLISRFW